MSGSKQYTFTEEDFDGEESSTYTIGFGVVDSVDTVVDSTASKSSLMMVAEKMKMMRAYKNQTMRLSIQHMAMQMVQMSFEFSTGTDSVGEFLLRSHFHSI